MAPSRGGLLSLGLTLLLLTAACARGRAPAPAPRTVGPVVEVGELAGAPFRIDIPPRWNGGLVLHCHGYRGAPDRFDPRVQDPVADLYGRLGYAVAQSGYSAGGYALREAAHDTETLRQHFAARHGSPRETWLTGMSLGGSVTMMMMELQPTTFDGGLALCAPLGPALGYIKATAFDLIALFELFFPGALPSPAQVPVAFRPTLERERTLERLLDAHEEGAAVLRRYTHARSNQELAPNLDLFVYILGELQRRWGGNAFDNEDTIYSGLGDDAAINDRVKRYRADEGARAPAIRDYTPTGRLSRPLLSLRTVYDPLIGPFASDRYAELAQIAGRGALFAQRHTTGSGHCAFTPEEMTAAFVALRAWSRTGRRPRPGVLIGRRD